MTCENRVHLVNYPTCDKSQINKILGKDMQTIIDIVTMGRAARNIAQIKNRQPLQAIYIPSKHIEVATRMKELILEEINVKEIRFLDEKNDIVTWHAKLNLKNAGPKFGKDIKVIMKFLEKTNINDVLENLSTNKSTVINIENTAYEISDTDLLINISEKDGFVFENVGNNFIALDVILTENLINEGHAREIVNKIQFTRKSNNFNIMDKIIVVYSGDERIKTVIEQHRDFIALETLSEDFIFINEIPTDAVLWEINGLQFYLSIEVV
jgi:isoleucyl-tRNA synthetase